MGWGGGRWRQSWQEDTGQVHDTRVKTSKWLIKTKMHVTSILTVFNK